MIHKLNDHAINSLLVIIFTEIIELRTNSYAEIKGAETIDSDWLIEWLIVWCCAATHYWNRITLLIEVLKWGGFETYFSAISQPFPIVCLNLVVPVKGTGKNLNWPECKRVLHW